MISSDLFQYYSHGGVAPGLQSICVNRQIKGYYSAEAAYSEGPKTDACIQAELNCCIGRHPIQANTLLH
jgi:hypothetical protein